MRLDVRGIPTEQAEHFRRGGADAHGQPPLVRVAEGFANPCRHCLEMIPLGDEKLVLAYRPFEKLQPYAESGPIFLHRAVCERYVGDALPPWFELMDPAIVRGYDAAHWIRYDTGRAVPGAEIADACREILADETIATVHVRSVFGCFQGRVDRG